MLLDLRHRLEYALLLAIVYLVRVLPLAVATAPTARICRFIAPKTRRHRRALKNLEKAMPGNSRGARLPAGDILLEYRPRAETQP
jgi:KDO2-lipid IV(A) lauroyltransferase